MESNTTVRDDLLSSISLAKSTQQRLKPTTNKLMKDAQDALVYHTSQSALLGGDNPSLHFDSISQADGFKAPLPKKSLTKQNLQQIEDTRSDLGKSMASKWDALSVSKFSSISQSPSVMTNNRHN